MTLQNGFAIHFQASPLISVRTESLTSSRSGRSVDADAWCKRVLTLNIVENLEPEFENDEDREEWEAEQKRLDREWYGLDDGYDETHNPFAGTSEEYAQKKEAQLAKLKRKKMSAQQRQINKVRVPEMPQIPFAFECNQLNGNLVDFGNR